jgi:hypothetical protein
MISVRADTLGVVAYAFSFRTLKSIGELVAVWRVRSSCSGAFQRWGACESQAGACERTQSAAEGALILRNGSYGLDGFSSGHDSGGGDPRRSPLRLRGPAISFNV